MKKVKKFSEMNEGNVYLNDEEFDDIDDRYEDIFDMSKYDTIYKVDLSYYVEFGFKMILEECIKYEIIPGKEIMKNMNQQLKNYSAENFLYQDQDHISEDELSYIVNDFLDELKNIQPEEYKKYEMAKNTNKYKI